MASGAPDDLELVCRLACIGSEDGTFHVLKKGHYSPDSAESIKSILSMNRGCEVIKRLKTIANQKCYVKKENLLFSLASMIDTFNCQENGHKNDAICNEAYCLVQELCETASDLFTFVHLDKQVRSCSKASWGRGMRKLISNWYTKKQPQVLACQITRNKSGHGFSHKDLIKQIHLKSDGWSNGTDLILNYLLKGKSVLDQASDAKDDKELVKVIAILTSIETLKGTQDSEKEVIRSLIETNGFLDRQIPTHFLRLREAFEGLIGHMPLPTLVKNIPKMAELGILDPMSPDAQKVIDHLHDPEKFKKERVSPVTVFIAMRKYHVNRMKKWIRNPKVSQTLNTAFDSSLETVMSTGKRYLFAVHVDAKIVKTCVTGSASTLSPIMPCAILAQILARVEDNPKFVYFTSSSISELTLTKSLVTVAIVEQLVQQTKQPSNENYDLCDPLKWAAEKKTAFDCVLIVCGKKNVTSQTDLHEAIRNYRTESGVADAKVAILGLSDPTPLPNRDDLGYLDVTGFDDDVPDLLQHFFKGFPSEG